MGKLSYNEAYSAIFSGLELIRINLKKTEKLISKLHVFYTVKKGATRRFSKFIHGAN